LKCPTRNYSPPTVAMRESIPSEDVEHTNKVKRWNGFRIGGDSCSTVRIATRLCFQIIDFLNWKVDKRFGYRMLYTELPRSSQSCLVIITCAFLARMPYSQLRTIHGHEYDQFAEAHSARHGKDEVKWWKEFRLGSASWPLITSARPWDTRRAIISLGHIFPGSRTCSQEWFLGYENAKHLVIINIRLRNRVVAQRGNRTRGW
jgi:hypothetical protein